MTTWQFVVALIFMLLVGAAHGTFITIFVKWVLKRI